MLQGDVSGRIASLGKTEQNASARLEIACALDVGEEFEKLRIESPELLEESIRIAVVVVPAASGLLSDDGNGRARNQEVRREGEELLEQEREPVFIHSLAMEAQNERGVSLVRS
jgi:hypothetical protein